VPKRIAWIEDDADIIYSVVKPLEEQGFTIEVYRTVQETLDNVERLRACDLILLDLILPSGKAEEEHGLVEMYAGVQLLQSLRSTHAMDLPVIVLSTAAAVERFTKVADELSVSDILVKPCLPRQLASSVISVLEAVDQQPE
jgi:CheY-like chemotaxis protein